MKILPIKYAFIILIIFGNEMSLRRSSPSNFKLSSSNIKWFYYMDNK